MFARGTFTVRHRAGQLVLSIVEGRHNRRAKDWNAYKRSKPQKFSGGVKTIRFNRDSYGIATMEAEGKTLTVVLAPPVRMDIRGLNEDTLKPGVAVTIEGFVSRRTPNDVRAES